MNPLQELCIRVHTFLEDMGIDPGPTEENLCLFKFGSTLVVISVFSEQHQVWCRMTSILLQDVEPTLECLHRLLRLNTEVLVGAFLLFEDNSLAFSATLSGESMSFAQFETCLRYVAQISDQLDDEFQELSGGKRARDLLESSTT